MPRRLTAKQAIDLHADIHKLISRSHARAAEMVRRGEHAARDGFPSTSMGGDGGGSDISRPTEREALAPVPQDRTGEWIIEWEKLLDEMFKKARVLDGLSQMVLAIEVDERGRQNTIPNCANPWCAVPLIASARAGRCEPCYRFRLDNGQDAGPEVIERRQERRERAEGMPA